jgi:hypothetical protein
MGFLKTITLVWTLLSNLDGSSLRCIVSDNFATEQNPYAGVGPVIGKALIVCPVSLVNVRDSQRLFLFDITHNMLTPSAELESRILQMVNNVSCLIHRVRLPLTLGSVEIVSASLSETKIRHS